MSLAIATDEQPAPEPLATAVRYDTDPVSGPRCSARSLGAARLAGRAVALRLVLDLLSGGGEEVRLLLLLDDGGGVVGALPGPLDDAWVAAATARGTVTLADGLGEARTIPLL